MLTPAAVTVSMPTPDTPAVAASAAPKMPSTQGSAFPELAQIHSFQQHLGSSFFLLQRQPEPIADPWSGQWFWHVPLRVASASQQLYFALFEPDPANW